MGKINVLSFAVANLIAAGEVVDRPASVIKELVENAIDSGADRITVEIQNGGVVFMRVCDNGCGIERDDLSVAVRRHATSKIRDAQDLDGIITLGFRGEALAAIAAVSDLRIISRVKGQPTGAVIEVSGGNILGVSDRGCSEGTSVIVENLFSNVPARRKFLKKDVTETAAVHSVVEKIALSHPEIAFTFIADGNVKMQTVGDGKLLNTIYALYGRDIAKRLLEVNYEHEGIRVTGYTGRSDNVKPNRNAQNFFINGRLVKSKTVGAAVEQAYCSYIPSEKFPVCTLFIDINPKAVDVNVHPAKLEVKFSNEKPVFEAVYYGIKNALESNTTRPDLPADKLSGMSYEEYRKLFSTQKTTSATTVNCATSEPAGVDIFKKAQIEQPPAVIDGPAPWDIEKETKPAYKYDPSEFTVEKYIECCENDPQAIVEEEEFFQEELPEPECGENIRQEEIIPRATGAERAVQQEIVDDSIPEYRIVGEVFNCYVIVEAADKMLLIDKHAAHERIIFEDLKSGRERDGRVASQSLLLPVTVILTADECSAADEYRSEFEAIGFEFELGAGHVNILAIPDAISVQNAESLFTEMLDDILKGKGNPELTEKLRREKALYQVACKAAIKGGRSYDASIIDWLVSRVLALPDIIVCPHGRPIAFKLTKSELDRQFNRIK